eukprot:scaffold49318_cov33-Tisochrysis_lutea.AAC.5
MRSSSHSLCLRGAHSASKLPRKERASASIEAQSAARASEWAARAARYCETVISVKRPHASSSTLALFESRRRRRLITARRGAPSRGRRGKAAPSGAGSLPRLACPSPLPCPALNET